jgi:purine-nucleoside phosphorylase
MKTVVLPVYVMRCLCVKVVIITNAAGGLNRNYKVGDVVCVSDHLAIPQLAGKNPLVGPNDDELGPRFPPTSNAYNDDLRAAAQMAAKELGLDFVIPHGTYCFVSGPMYESKAECRFLHSLGGDVVGMSTIPEVVSAHHCEMNVLCLSLVTNKVIMDGDEGQPVASHQEVLEAVEQRSEQILEFTKQIIKVLDRGHLHNIEKLTPVHLEAARLAYAKQEAAAKGRSKYIENGTVSYELLVYGAMFFAAGSLFTTYMKRAA